VDYLKMEGLIMEMIINNIFSQWITWLVLSLLIIIAATKIITLILFHLIKDSKKYHLVRRVIYYIAGVLYIVIAIYLWQGNINDLATFLGFLSAGIAIALKDVFANIAGWIFIVLRKPFTVGHRITIEEKKGDVIDIRMFQFSLIEVAPEEQGGQSTGRIVDIPNGYIFIYPFVNYTKGFKFIWEEIEVLLTFDSNWQEAKEKMLAITEKHAGHFAEEAEAEFQKAVKKYMIHYGVLTPIVYTSVSESGVELTIRYLCPVKQIRNINGLIWEDILQLIKENEEISLAYPTYTIHSKVEK
jgi:small-conductance mechanosensitive channel